MPFWKRKSITPNPAPLSPSQPQWQTTLPARGNPIQQPVPAQAPAPPAINPFYQRGDEFFNEADYKNAVFMYREALRQPMDLTTQNSLLLQLTIAQTMVDPPELADALSNINRAVQLDPSNGQTWRVKADIHERQGDYASAKEALTHASALVTGYDKIQVSQALARLQSNTTSGFTTANSQNVQSQQHTQHTQSNPSTAPNVTTPAIVTQAPSQGLGQPASPSISISQASQPASTSYATPSSSRQSPFGASAGPSSPSFSSAGQSPAPGSSLNVPASPPRATTPNSAFGASLAQQLNIPTEAPPAYSSNTAPLGGPGSSIFPEEQFRRFKAEHERNRQGALYLRPVTAEGSIDIICLLFWGKTYIQSILMDISPVVTQNASWKPYNVSTISNPGTTFLDYDSETSTSYDGYHGGTVSVLGYTEEYREFQIAATSQLQLYLVAETICPLMETDQIHERLLKLQRDPNLEDNAGLRQILGIRQGVVPTTVAAATRTAIEDICMILNKGFRDVPSRFQSPLVTESFSAHIFGTSGIGLRNFMFMILLGAELTLRMDKLGSSQKYPNFMTNSTSALAVIARQWMENVLISKKISTKEFIVKAIRPSQQEQALISFAETIGWPYMDEARQNINGLYQKVIVSPASVHSYLIDWLYGLVLPGKFFRHRIMSCLVLACPSTKHLGIAPFYQNALVVGDKSYWPKRTAIGRILAGEVGVRTTCGWVGPVKAPSGTSTNWVHISHKEVDFVTPVVDNLLESDMEILGFSEADTQSDPLRTVSDMMDMAKWKPPTGLPRRADADKASLRKAAQLENISLTKLAGIEPMYQALLTFISHGQRVNFTLYNNPVFVHVPKCQGSSHPVHERMVNKMLSNLVLVKNLKNSTLLPTKDTLMIIDATQQGEEAVAKAWCAETGRHAIVRKNGVGCFTCATNMATRRTGLGFNVLIWCS